MNLPSISNTRGSQYGAVAIAKMISKLDSPFINWLDTNSAFRLAATEDFWRPVNATSSLQTRDEGTGYTKTLITVEDNVPTGLAMHGDAIMIDETRIADSERGLLDIRRYLDARVPAEFQAWLEAFEVLLNQGSGSGDPLEILGLLNLINGISDLPGWTGEKGLINAKDYAPSGADTLDLTNTDNYRKFVMLVRLIIALVPGINGILMSPLMYAIFCDVADQYHAGAETRDNLGKTVPAFDNVPLIKLLNGTILNTENDDGDNPCTTSLYFARAGEDYLTLLTNSGLDWKPYDLGAADLKAGAEEWEVRAEWSVRTRNCIRRVRNIQIISS